MKIQGLIDIHSHGLGRYDTRTKNPEVILRVAEMHARAGTAAILPTIHSGTVQQMRANMKAVRQAIKAQKKEDMKFSRPTGKTPSPVTRSPRAKPTDAKPTDHMSQILGIHLEGPFLNPVRCGAQDRRSLESPSVSGLKKLIDGYEDIIKIITIAPEIPGAIRVIEKCVSLGIKVNMGHSDATYKQALKGKKAGASGISHIFNAMRPFHHREPGLIGLGLLDEDIYIEVIADNVHIDEITMQMIFKTKRLDRIILVSDSVKGRSDKKGRIYTRQGVLAGSSITLSDAVRNVKKTGITEAIVLETAVDNPKRYLGYQK
jgi:N-acetylglucosamine-6-phosphate deacetylase